MKFKVGDRVSVNDREGSVIKIEPYYKYQIYVKWDNHKYSNCYYESESDLELVDEPIINVDEMFAEIEL
jgi:hypothetical protein